MISEKEKFFDPRKPFASKRPETHEEWQARMGGEVLAVVRSGLYLDFRFLDMALSALTPVPDERCGVLATDGVNLYYQPAPCCGSTRRTQNISIGCICTRYSTAYSGISGSRASGMPGCGSGLRYCRGECAGQPESFQRQAPLTWVRQNAYAAIAAGGQVVARCPGVPDGWRARPPAFCASWSGNSTPMTTACGPRMPRAAPADAHAPAPEDVAEDR